KRFCSMMNSSRVDRFMCVCPPCRFSYFVSDSLSPASSAFISERVVYKKLNSTGMLIQRTTMDAPQQTYVLHRARRSQEDDQLLHQRCKRSSSEGSDDCSESYGTGWLDDYPGANRKFQQAMMVRSARL